MNKLKINKCFNEMSIEELGDLNGGIAPIVAVGIGIAVATIGGNTAGYGVGVVAKAVAVTAWISSHRQQVVTNLQLKYKLY